MGGAPPYEENPSPHFLAVLRATVPGFEPTADGWLLVEKGLKRLLRIRDRGAFASVPADFLLSWREEDVLRVFDPLVSPFPEVRARHRTPPERPAFPEHPLDPSCVVAATLSANVKTEVVRLVRLVQPDFDPEKDPRGWDSVAELVWGSGRPAGEVRQMGYGELDAFFRVRHGQLKIQLGGTIETNTPSITFCDAAPPAPHHKPRPRGEPASELLHKLWTTREGKEKILAAGSAEKIGMLIGKSTTAVKEAGPIWDTKIRPALDAQRTLIRYHRGEERLDG